MGDPLIPLTSFLLKKMAGSHDSIMTGAVSTARSLPDRPALLVDPRSLETVTLGCGYRFEHPWLLTKVVFS